LPKAQTYSNHRRYYWPHHFIVQPILIANFAMKLNEFFELRNWDSGWEAILAFGLMLFALTARAMALKAQNRAIRVEEKLRLERLLPPDDRSRMDQLTMSQLIGLRFAPDDEVPELVQRLLRGELKSGSDVKKSVVNWRPDYHRV
jgi:hypothetical protein